ncbi:MAG: hypothetical protein FWG50_12235 [Kiritimatiellaeota bacterium]|nr:hypothetical protein [Kiritimatiellota bacterium]
MIDAGRKPCAPGLALPALAAALAAALALSARGGGVAVPLPVYADMEASAALALAAPGARDRSLTVALSLEASAANNAEAAFFAAGCGDVPAAVIGWDCGEWFVAGGRLRERLAAPAAAGVGVRTLTARIRLDASGAPVGAAFADSAGGAVAFGGADPEALLSWLDPRGWGSLRVTSRGGASAAAAVAVSYPDGTAVIVR